MRGEYSLPRKKSNSNEEITIEKKRSRRASSKADFSGESKQTRKKLIVDAIDVEPAKKRTSRKKLDTTKEDSSSKPKKSSTKPKKSSTKPKKSRSSSKKLTTKTEQIERIGVKHISEDNTIVTKLEETLEDPKKAARKKRSRANYTPEQKLAIKRCKTKAATKRRKAIDEDVLGKDVGVGTRTKSFIAYKRERLSIARQLCYDKDIIDMIKSATSEIEIDQYLALGRKR